MPCPRMESCAGFLLRVKVGALAGSSRAHPFSKEGESIMIVHRRLTTFAVVGAVVALASAEAQTVAPNVNSHRFIASALRIDPETSTAEALTAGTFSVPSEAGVTT